jgi:zinc transporter ZupT
VADVNAALTVFGFALLTALATGLGALPFALVRSVSERAVAFANAIAAGLMLGASFGLATEGTRYGGVQTLTGATAGVVFILITHRWLRGREVSFGAGAAPQARQAMLMVVVMTVHSFAEGVAVGVSFGGGMTLAAAITIAIAVHNIPEGLAISAVLRPRGFSVLKCAGWSQFSSLPQPLMAVPAFLLVEAFRVALPYGVGFAAGAMVFMVLVELLPEALDAARRPAVALVVSATMVGMVLFQRHL